MASLLFSFAGAAVGGAAFGPVGALAGRIAGAVAGSFVDQALLGGTKQVEGPRLSDLDVTTSTEGAPIPRLYGRGRIGGQVIWATPLEEVASTQEQRTGSKGGGSVVTTTYSYFANFAVGLAEGEVAHVARIWADGKLLDLTNVTWRFHRGSPEQEPDPLIVAHEGAGNAPAYRGTAYVVFERLPLDAFGNRIPQLSFELIRPVGKLEGMVRAVTLIPGTTEFGYETRTVTRNLGPGRSGPENRHVAHARSDVIAALDELQALCPLLESVAVVVAWFGDDLRAGHCTLRPGVDLTNKLLNRTFWSVGDVTRAEAHLVSQTDGRANFGGTPSDSSVVHLIQELKARGLKVTLYPFIMMDVPPDNTLPDPWSGAASQPAFPWRGRITCDPAPGQPGTVDASAEAAAQVDAFFGSDGPEEWSYRRMILHYAHLAQGAGGVDAILIGSEMRALTRVRGAGGAYPAVAHLAALAADVRAICGAGTKISYAADWTEYGAHVIGPDAETVRFPLDALWASPAIDAVGIDYYAPLSDWRDTPDHLDLASADTIDAPDYLAANVAGGEGFDWHYADAAARAAQARTPIADGSGKPWVFRAKDIWSWWSEPHHERTGGVEQASPTAWTPKAKPIWLTECGCPAVNKGANQPSSFPDPRSSEGGAPFFSNATRDDLIQRRYLEAVVGAFDPALGTGEERNPLSPLYGGRMLDPAALYLWTWDARPYPFFPAALDVWSDGGNWETGHWLNGRLGAAPMDALVARILEDAGIENFDTSALRGVVDGYVIDRAMSPRAAIDGLARAFAFAAIADGEVIAFRPRGGPTRAALTRADLVEPGEGASLKIVRAQETELPREVTLSFTDTGHDYRRSTVNSRRLAVESARVSSAMLAAATSDAVAAQRAEIWLQDVWAGREEIEFTLPPSLLRLTAGDVVDIDAGERVFKAELREAVGGDARRARARSIFPDVLDGPVLPATWHMPPSPPSLGPAFVMLADLPRLPDDTDDILQRAAVFAQPWPGAVAVWRSDDGAAFAQRGAALLSAVCGTTLDALGPGVTGLWDRANAFRVRLHGGALSSKSENLVLGGANAAAVRRADGQWEVLQFCDAVLVGESTYRLSRLLRGQLGTEWAAAETLPAEAAFVLLDDALTTIARGVGEIGRSFTYRFVAAGRDHGDDSAVEMVSAPGAVALRPYAPVHLDARREAGDVRLSWVRRSRIGGDGFDAVEIPLGEDLEAYDVEILSGDTVKRTLPASAQTVLYAAADELADFGAAQSQVVVRIYQRSAVIGRGTPASATVVIQP